MVRVPALCRGLDLHGDTPLGGKLERVGKQVLDDLLRAKSICLGMRLPTVFSASCWPRMRIELSGVRNSCDMFAKNSDLYFDVSANSAAFSSRARRASSTSLFFRSTST